MAGVISTSNHPRALWPGVKGFWGQAYDEHVVEYTDLVDTTTSEKAYEEFVQSVGFGLAPVKLQGRAAVFDSDTQGRVARFVHVAYALGYIVTHEELKDNLYMEVSNARAPANARSFRQTKERIVAGLYNRAFNVSFPVADGKPLCAVDHPRISGGTYSNTLAVPAALSEAALEDLTIQIAQATDDRGLTINLMPQSLHIASGNMFNATRIMQSVLRSGTPNNDINAVREMGLIPKGVKMNHYLTTPAAWFLRTNVPTGRGLVLCQREEISFTQDNDFSTKNALALGYERYSAGVIDPLALFGTNGP